MLYYKLYYHLYIVIFCGDLQRNVSEEFSEVFVSHKFIFWIQKSYIISIV